MVGGADHVLVVLHGLVQGLQVEVLVLQGVGHFVGQGDLGAVFVELRLAAQQAAEEAALLLWLVPLADQHPAELRVACRRPPEVDDGRRAADDLLDRGVDERGVGVQPLLLVRVLDERLLEAYEAEEISVGDYVLSGGEQAAMILLDAVIRLLPGVIGNADTHTEESFGNGLLEYPHYTRPAEWVGPDGVARAVPDVLVSGNHARVREWRLQQAEKVTRERRPDLWDTYLLQKPEESKKIK